MKYCVLWCFNPNPNPNPKVVRGVMERSSNEYRSIISDVYLTRGLQSIIYFSLASATVTGSLSSSSSSSSSSRSSPSAALPPLRPLLPAPPIFV